MQLPSHLRIAHSGRRQLTLRRRELHETLERVRAEQAERTWWAKYALRSGAESTMHQAVTTTGIRDTRYRGLAKVSLQHSFTAIALNLTRLHAWWTGAPTERLRRSSHLARLDYALAAVITDGQSFGVGS